MSEYKRGSVTEETREESRRLRAIWDAAQNRKSQAEFGQTFAIGSQAAVGHFLNGHAAISLKAAKGFAQGLGCEISDFSPRLAAAAAALGEVAGHVRHQPDLTDLDKSELHLVMLFRGMTHERRTALLAQASDLYAESQSGNAPLRQPQAQETRSGKKTAKLRRSVEA